MKSHAELTELSNSIYIHTNTTVLQMGQLRRGADNTPLHSGCTHSKSHSKAQLRCLHLLPVAIHPVLVSPRACTSLESPCNSYTIQALVRALHTVRSLTNWGTGPWEKDPAILQSPREVEVEGGRKRHHSERQKLEGQIWLTKEHSSPDQSQLWRDCLMR